MRARCASEVEASEAAEPSVEDELPPVDSGISGGSDPDPEVILAGVDLGRFRDALASLERIDVGELEPNVAVSALYPRTSLKNDGK